MEGNVEEPLLQFRKKVYPNCPGCKVVQRHEVESGPPVKELLVIALLVLCNALPIASLFPYLYFMVEDFQIAKSKDDIGYYVGALGSAFMIGRCATGVLWGMVADKYGRKPVIIIGVASVIIFGTGFGFSTNFWFALSMRLLLGSFNGMLGTVKAYASEICSKTYQALGISIVGTCWGLGLIIGPALGGYLSQPASKYPGFFPAGSLFDRYPYLLPSFCCSVFAVVVLIICIRLPETLHKHDRSDPLKERNEVSTEIQDSDLPHLKLPGSRLANQIGSKSSVSVLEGIDSPALMSLVLTPFGSGTGSFEDCKRSVSARSHSQGPVCRLVEKDPGNGEVGHGELGILIPAADEEGVEPRETNDFICSLKEWQDRQGGEYVARVPYPAKTGDEDAVQELLESSGDSKKNSIWLLTSHPLMASIGVYCLWSLQDIAYTEIFSLWCVSPKAKGGLGFTTADVGTLLALSGFGMLVFQLLFFPILGNYLGPILTTRIGAGLAIPLLTVMPFFPALPGRTLWIILCITSVLKFIFSVTSLTGSFILINNAVPQDKRGAANGLSMSLASLFKAIGPAAGGAIFAWAQSRQHPSILPGNDVVFFFLGSVSLLMLISTLQPILPPSTNHPYVE